jgi:hypothetical protein
MKKTMYIPGFDAEAALLRESNRYQAGDYSPANGNTIQPATSPLLGGSTVIIPRRPPVYFSCNKWLCYNIGPTGHIFCGYFPGSWNPATGRCE